MSLISDGLFVPAAVLALLAWLVPKLLSMVMPEGVKPLLLIAFLSTVILFLLSAGLIAGLLWAPIMVLSVANLPRGWVKKVW